MDSPPPTPSSILRKSARLTLINLELIFPSYWGKNFLNTTQYTQIMSFSTLAGANRHHTQSSETSRQSFQDVFLLRLAFSCMHDHHSTEYSKEILSRSPQFSVLLDPKNFSYLGFKTCLTLLRETQLRETTGFYLDSTFLNHSL